jgi:molecular chaperone GrpE
VTDQPLREGSDPRGLTPDAAASVTEGSDPTTGLTPDTLASVEAERDEYLVLAQRVQADFENYRKRAARDQERLVAHAHERLVRELLPVLDDLERTLEAAENHEEAAKPPVRDSGPVEGARGNREVPPREAGMIEGVKLVEQSLRRALEKEGLAEIETDGSFDPHVHEALLTRPGDGAEPGSVLEVVQRGYRVGDKVVRPARVIVAE